MTVGERIKELRTKLGMSQVDFADKLNVSKQTLYKYENNIITNIPSDKVEEAARIGSVSPAYLMGWSNYEEDPRLVERDAILQEIEHILELQNYTLCCESYDSDYFTIQNKNGQTVASFFDYELLNKYEALQKRGKVTAQLLISSNDTSFLKYLESLGYHIYKDDSEHKLLLTLKNSEIIRLEYDTFEHLKSKVEKYTIATIDSKVLALKESELRKERLEKEKLVQFLQMDDSLALDAANDRSATSQHKKNADDIMHNDSEWE